MLSWVSVWSSGYVNCCCNRFFCMLCVGLSHQSILYEKKKIPIAKLDILKCLIIYHLSTVTSPIKSWYCPKNTCAYVQTVLFDRLMKGSTFSYLRRWNESFPPHFCLIKLLFLSTGWKIMRVKIHERDCSRGDCFLDCVCSCMCVTKERVREGRVRAWKSLLSVCCCLSCSRLFSAAQRMVCMCVCAHVCQSGVREYYSLSELNVKHGCVNGLRDRNDESSYQQAERPQLPPSTNLNLRWMSDSLKDWLFHWLCIIDFTSVTTQQVQHMSYLYVYTCLNAAL